MDVGIVVSFRFIAVMSHVASIVNQVKSTGANVSPEAGATLLRLCIPPSPDRLAPAQSWRGCFGDTQDMSNDTHLWPPQVLSKSIDFFFFSKSLLSYSES